MKFVGVVNRHETRIQRTILELPEDRDNIRKTGYRHVELATVQCQSKEEGQKILNRLLAIILDSYLPPELRNRIATECPNVTIHYK